METDADQVAGALMLSIGLLVRRLRQGQGQADDLTIPQTSALARLDRGGPATATDLARQEQISPQSVGATIATLEARGLVGRRPDPGDGRRSVLSVTEAGRAVLRGRRGARADRLAAALAAGFTEAEIAQLMTAAPLIERLAQAI